MSLSSGTLLGPYEILSPLGAGGMGEVYRARDTKLDRDVAVKVLPARLAESREAFDRFEREAKAVAALSHPNILAIHDFGTHEGTAYAVMELLEGETLRERLAGGALPHRKVVDYGAQVARGLAAAHERGIVHRDLKPENVVVTPDGRVKILDFGLARHSALLAAADQTSSPTLGQPTDPGTVMGTAGYMSPEQVRGDPADHRSDVFSLGCVIFEMLTGRRAFQEPTAAETMTAILQKDPFEPSGPEETLPPALERTLRHCLEKSPAERFQSARDLAFDLEASTDVTGRSAAQRAVRPQSRRVPLGAGLAALAAALMVGLLAGWLLGTRREGGERAPEEPRFTRLTFEQGTVWNARFTPDGETVVYAAAWDGEPIRLFFTRLDSPQPTALSLPDASLLSISSTGELAVSLGHAYEGWMGEGTLARTPLLGEGARPVLRGVREADWSPDGGQLAAVRRVEGRERLEFPAENVLYDTAGFISHIRFSPQGDRIAFADHGVWADDVGSVAVVDLSGHKRTLTDVWAGGISGLAWSPDGHEIWFTASRDDRDNALRAVDLEGRQRLLMAGLTQLSLFDVSPGGRILLGRATSLRNVEALMAGRPGPEDVSMAIENTAARFIAPDGGVVLLSDQSTNPYTAFLRRADGSPPIRLGDGDAYGLSPDGRWVVTITADAPSRILLHPTGPGETREVSNSAQILVAAVAWLPDGRGLAAIGPTPTERSRGWWLDPDGGAPRPFTGEGVSNARLAVVVSPDGSRLVARDTEGHYQAYPLDGGPPEPIPGVADDQRVVQWAEDGRALFVGRQAGPTWTIHRLDLESGEETPWTEITPGETAGLRLSWVYLSPNGRYWVHSYSRLLTDLYVVEALRQE
jgi:Tol biopolymer transport system component